MEVFGELGKYGGEGVAIAAIIAMVILGKVITSMVERAVSRFLDSYEEQNKEQLKVIRANTKATNKQTQVGTETQRYLRNKNGQMEECFMNVVDRLEKLDRDIRK